MAEGQFGGTERLQGPDDPGRQPGAGAGARTRPVPVVSRLTWSNVGTPQNATPFTSKGKPYLLEIDEFGSGANIGAGRIIDIADPKRPAVVSDLRLAVNQAEAQGADLEGDPGNDQQFQGYQGHYCSLPEPGRPDRRSPAASSCRACGSSTSPTCTSAGRDRVPQQARRPGLGRRQPDAGRLVRHVGARPTTRRPATSGTPTATAASTSCGSPARPRGAGSPRPSTCPGTDRSGVAPSSCATPTGPQVPCPGSSVGRPRPPALTACWTTRTSPTGSTLPPGVGGQRSCTRLTAAAGPAVGRPRPRGRSCARSATSGGSAGPVAIASVVDVPASTVQPSRCPPRPADRPTCLGRAG